MGFLSDVWSSVKDTWKSLAPAASTILGTIVGGPVGTAAGAAIGGVLQQKNEQDYNSSEAEKNRDFQLDVWNMNNEYNSPVEQLKRAQAAGINPNAVIGSNGYSSAVSSAPAGSQAAGTPSIANTILTQDAVIRNLMAQTENVQADTDNKRYELTYNKISEPDRLKALKNMNKEQEAKVQKIMSDIGMNDFNKDLQENMYQWFCWKSEEEINEIKAKVNLLRNQNINLVKEGNLLDKQGQKLDKEIDKIGNEAEGIDINNQLESLKLQFSQITGIPAGTPLHEAMFKLGLEGKFDEMQQLISNVVLTNNATNHSNTIEGALARKVEELFSTGSYYAVPFFNTQSGNKSTRNPTR